MSWLEALKNLGIETIRDTEIDTDPTSSAIELSESLDQQGAKSAKRGEEGLLSLLAPPHIRNHENRALRDGCRAKANPTKGRPWLETLKSLEEEVNKEVKSVILSVPLSS